MINVAEIAKATVEVLKAWPALSDVKAFERCEYVNVDADRLPWIGVYRGTVDYDPHTMGPGSRSWRAVLQQRIAIQEVDKRGERAEDKLEQRIQQVLEALIANLNLNGTVDIITSFRREPGYVETDRDTMYFQSDEIIITAEVRTR